MFEIYKVNKVKIAYNSWFSVYQKLVIDWKLKLQIWKVIF